MLDDFMPIRPRIGHNEKPMERVHEFRISILHGFIAVDQAEQRKRVENVILL